MLRSLYFFPGMSSSKPHNPFSPAVPSTFSYSVGLLCVWRGRWGGSFKDLWLSRAHLPSWLFYSVWMWVETSPVTSSGSYSLYNSMWGHWPQTVAQTGGLHGTESLRQVSVRAIKTFLTKLELGWKRGELRLSDTPVFTNWISLNLFSTEPHNNPVISLSIISPSLQMKKMGG